MIHFVPVESLAGNVFGSTCGSLKLHHEQNAETAEIFVKPGKSVAEKSDMISNILVPSKWLERYTSLKYEQKHHNRPPNGSSKIKTYYRERIFPTRKFCPLSRRCRYIELKNRNIVMAEFQGEFRKNKKKSNILKYSIEKQHQTTF